MRWRIIDKRSAAAPSTGDYRSWKPKLALEAELQCVYCCIHESRFGGIRNFHVEHFRPQSKFPLLRDDYSNLFYACGVCNSFKSDDWPADLDPGDLTSPGYPSPADVDYNEFLHVDERTGEVHGDGVTGRYLVERLHLNRGHLVALRALVGLFAKLKDFEQSISEIVESKQVEGEFKDEVIKILLRITSSLRAYSEVRPYSHDQLRHSC